MAKIQELIEQETKQGLAFKRLIGGEDKIDEDLKAAWRKTKAKFKSTASEMPSGDTIFYDCELWWGRLLRALPRAYKAVLLTPGVKSLILRRLIALRKAGELPSDQDDKPEKKDGDLPEKKKVVKTAIPKSKFDAQLQDYLEQCTKRTRAGGEKISLSMLVETALANYLSPGTDEESREKLLENFGSFITTTLTSRIE